MNVGDLIAPTSDLSAWDMNPVRKKHKPQELPLDLLLTEPQIIETIWSVLTP